MPTAVKSATRPSADMSDEEFLAFIEPRPREERWQLIDGEPVMMNPPKLRHQLVGANLASHLNHYFWAHRPELCALQEVGVVVPGVRRFRSRPDVAVVDDLVDLDASWADRFLLVAEILSDSNRPREIERKRRRYIEHPMNLYVLVIAQTQMHVDVWSRRTDWQSTTLTRPEEVIELPELGAALPLRLLYAGARLA